MSGFSTVAHSSAAIIPFLGGEQPAYLSTPSRDREAAGRFLHLLDPAARDFTFQAFDERGVDASLARNTSDRAEIVRLYEQGAGVYVTVNETNLIGRKSENIKRVRAIWQEDDEGHGGLSRLSHHSSSKPRQHISIDIGWLWTIGPLMNRVALTSPL
jgi:hypothetical protein